MRIYVIGRSDLAPGHRAVQAMHALARYQDLYRSPSDCTLVFLETDDVQALHERLRSEGVDVAGWGESYYGKALTALAAGPEGACYVAHLPLALREAA